MRTFYLIFLLIMGAVGVYLSCTKDTHFNPTEDIGVTIEAFVCDSTDLDTTITISDSLSGTVTALSVYAGQTITFLGFIKGDSVNDLTWSWDFGDTITSASRIAEHRYMTAGEYKAVFTITNSVGVSLSDTVTISVSAIQQKAAVMGYAYLEGKSDHTGIQVKFINKISSETIILETQKNGLFKVISNFSDGLYNVYYNDTLFKAFSPVTITDVSIIKGIMNELGKVILEDIHKPHIVNNSPTGTVDDTRLPSIKTAFIDSASGIAPETFLLIFNGDTIADSLINCDTSGFSWTPAARLPDGNYSVQASICDSAGNMDSITWSFRVDAMRLAAYGDTTVSIYDSVNLYGKVENVYSQMGMHKWDFDGNGTWDDSIYTSDTIISAKYSYPNDTTYKVVLYAKDDNNMVKYDTIEVTVLQDNPIVNLGNDTILSINDSIIINGTVSDSFGTIISMEWNFGISGFSDDTAMYISLSIDSKNTPYISYVKEQFPTTAEKLSVMIFNATSWEYLGKKGFSDGDASDISLSIDGGNIPYVAYRDIANGAHSTVMKYSGTSWEPVGNKGFSDGNALSVSIAIDSNNMPYVVFSDESVGGKVTVMQYR